MKILMVNKFLFPKGGSETYMFKLGEYLTSIGHEVQYFGMEHPDNCVGNNAKAYTSNMDFHNAGALSKIKYSLKTIYSPEARKKMKAVLEDFAPDAVHLNNFNYQLTPSVINAVNDYEKQSGKRIRLIYTAHDYQLVCPNHMMHTNGRNCEKCTGGKYFSCAKNKCIHNSFAKSIIGTAEAALYDITKVYKRIDTVICCSEFMKSKLDTNPLFKNKTVALHNFINTVENKAIPKDNYVLYFGRYSHEKGISVLIEAAEKSDVEFICAGSGPLEEEIEKCDKIRNVGFKSGRELEELIRKAKCTVIPSLWYENCPFSVMESIMYATPVIGSRIGGIPELIDDGKTGYLFNPGDCEDLLKKITALDADDASAHEMSENCLNKRFDTVNTYCEKLIKIYQG